MKETRIQVARDGLVVIGNPIMATLKPHEAWCEIVKDALLAKRWEAVYRMLEKHDDDELAEAPNEDVHYTLPLVECDNAEQAKQLIVRFCKMGIGSHPLLASKERWYYIPNFGGEVEDVLVWSKKFERAL